MNECYNYDYTQPPNTKVTSEHIQLKKVTVTIRQEWEPVDPENTEDVELAAKLSEIPTVWNLNPKKMNISQKRDVTPIRVAGSDETVEMDVGPTTATVSGELLDE